MIIAMAIAACMAANGWRLRRRLRGLRTLPPGDEGEADPDYVLLTARHVEVPDRVARAAERYARENGLGLLDLMPRDIPVDGALDLARHTDFGAYRDDAFGMGRGACHAVLASRDAVAAAGLRAGERDPDELGAATARLKLYVERADIAVAGIAGHDQTAFRRARMRALALVIPQTLALPQTLGAMAAGYLLVAGTLAAAPAAGLLLALWYCAVPQLIFAGAPVRPRDLHRVSLLRPVHVPLSIVRTLAAPRTGWERALLARREEARARYRAELERGTGRFVGPRSPECPWCGSDELDVHVTARDVLQGKPGRFTLERCGNCGHIFQNPRVTPEGLDFYYRDVYDGLGDVLAERIFTSNTSWYLARVAMVRRAAEPRSWLDVGTGKGHFCRAARTVLPEARLDGLDFGAAVAEGAQRGWIDTAYRGEFRALAADLAGRYDVISMHHYLEHTTDPLAELDTATKVLPPGGHLLIEMPDPESWFGRVLRGHWVPWLAPQHLHMIPLANLLDALERRGFEVVSRERREADQGPDFAASAAAVVNRLGLDVDRPWWPRVPGAREYARVLAVLVLAAPLMGAAVLLDLLTVPIARRNSNAYRVLARKNFG
ncbi:class I SAM-dependent methyltransferase [Actinomadura sp. WMMB 499]|uniref:class I SAM-dependent methyltransferase n=1 Tax=Actinomadura sp. WMMB 499 TaxID=1219491 RepID=UPI001247BAB4|nr:class I SAM-dependent methyltransferase [Actinomadura sp. WMMB 499]QFG22577.1 class I SAM-dependent methyltransferase [Actinomadura sp. WMMB 499]